jgi:hypothetical protein
VVESVRFGDQGLVRRPGSGPSDRLIAGERLLNRAG